MSVSASATRLSAAAKATLLKNQKRALQLAAQNQFQALQQEDLLQYVMEAASLWKGTVTLPRGASSAERRRLVVAEYEEYFVDDDASYNALPLNKGRRLVFVEHIDW